MRIIYSCLLIAIALTGTQQCVAQYGTFGEDTCPEDSAAVDDIIYYGELLDMSGGYLTGDTVFDFTVYDFDGNPLNLYTELSGEKPVVLINGSVSCLRFRGTFEPDNNGQQYVAARNYLEEHINDYNWIFIYGVEAHPTDGNCPSNCPPTVSNDTTVVQPPFYVDRRWAVRGWEDSPEHDFPFTMYADNPNNAVYNNFFQRPFGMVAINCDGTVAMRGDWVNSFFMNSTNVTALNEWRLESNPCSIEWTPDDDGTNDDMSGGYLTGDTVFDFTVYDSDGNPLNLYTELSGEKPVVLINGSVSCLRFPGHVRARQQRPAIRGGAELPRRACQRLQLDFHLRRRGAPDGRELPEQLPSHGKQ